MDSRLALTQPCALTALGQVSLCLVGTGAGMPKLLVSWTFLQLFFLLLFSLILEEGLCHSDSLIHSLTDL